MQELKFPRIAEVEPVPLEPLPSYHDNGQVTAALRRSSTTARMLLNAGVRVERRTIVFRGRPVEVDVKLCPTAHATGRGGRPYYGRRIVHDGRGL